MEVALLLGGLAALLLLKKSSSAAAGPSPAPTLPLYSSTTVVPNIPGPASASYQRGPVPGAEPVDGEPTAAQREMLRRARTLAGGGFSLGYVPSLAKAIAGMQALLGPQGYTYVSGPPTQPHTFTVVDSGPFYGPGGGRVYSVRYAMWGNETPPSVFVGPGSAVAAMLAA